MKHKNFFLILCCLLGFIFCLDLSAQEFETERERLLYTFSLTEWVPIEEAWSELYDQLSNSPVNQRLGIDFNFVVKYPYLFFDKDTYYHNIERLYDPAISNNIRLSLFLFFAEPINMYEVIDTLMWYQHPHYKGFKKRFKEDQELPNPLLDCRADYYRRRWDFLFHWMFDPEMNPGQPMNTFPFSIITGQMSVWARNPEYHERFYKVFLMVKDRMKQSESRSAKEQYFVYVTAFNFFRNVIERGSGFPQELIDESRVLLQKCRDGQIDYYQKAREKRNRN